MRDAVLARLNAGDKLHMQLVEGQRVWWFEQPRLDVDAAIADELQAAGLIVEVGDGLFGGFSQSWSKRGPIKALTIWQPWATLIMIGAKPYEFRSWEPPKSLIGERLAIHAGARPVKAAEVRALIMALRTDDRTTIPCLHKDIALPILERVLDGLKKVPASPSAAIKLPLSHVLGTVRVGEPKRGDLCAQEFGADAGNDSDRDGTFNWGWPMEDVQPLVPPLPTRGAQGLWEWRP
jgi:hypothetical protein